ncbi:MAG TPA: Bax inhibitor-1/YccA family protein [Thermoanaerobaculia bacterium]|jgi:FtsH-binding integral membrane protein
MDPYNTSNPPWISASTAELEFRTRAFIRSVYMWMAGGLILTAVAALWVISSPMMRALVLGNPIVMFGLIIAELGIVVVMSVRQRTITAGGALAAFLVYSFLNGMTLSVIFVVYRLGSITLAFGVSAGMYAAMAVYGLATKRDLTSWGSFFTMGLFGVIILSVVGMFIHATALQMTIATIGIFVFLGLTAYDNQKLKRYAVAGPSDSAAIFGALMLYLDFINLFLFVLRLLGDRRR